MTGVGVVGAGLMGSIHARLLGAAGGRLVAAAGRDRAAAERLGGAAFSDGFELIASPDARCSSTARTATRPSTRSSTAR